MSPLTIDQIRVPRDVFDRNQTRQGADHFDECFVCGRGLTAKALERGWWIEMATSGEILPTGDPRSGGPDSQGSFPLGSECAKTVPLTHRRRLLA